MIHVRVGALPQTPIRSHELADGSTVSDALASAGIALNGREVRVGGHPATMETRLSDGDTVLVTAQVKGN